jgi:hypothetical protein
MSSVMVRSAVSRSFDLSDDLVSFQNEYGPLGQRLCRPPQARLFILPDPTVADGLSGNQICLSERTQFCSRHGAHFARSMQQMEKPVLNDCAKFGLPGHRLFR